MRAFPDLYLLRHGETEWNAAGRMQGWLDSPLTEKGRGQAAAQALILAGLDLGYDCYVSPSGRTKQTAEIALNGSAAESDDRLREIMVGDWQGRIKAELAAERPEFFPQDDPFFWYDHAPGGEGYLGLEARCRAFLDDLSAPAIIVTHGITSRMLRCLALGMTPDHLGELPGGQGVVHAVVNGLHKTHG